VSSLPSVPSPDDSALSGAGVVRDGEAPTTEGVGPGVETPLPLPLETSSDRPYQSLYRRYRPQSFAEVRGQSHVTLALRNAVRDARVGHAYLFSGPRGTGKTSTARILAKALNCLEPEDGEPCNACASCLSVTDGSSFDVHELDAASNNGVDAMRELVARTSLATPGRSKVYIVDEVHMLTTAASNTLLKTLEEPPSHVVFVLATTDPQKVLPTIRSRTQHFEFRLLGPDTLRELVEDVAADASLELSDAALEVAVRRGRGSARDALSMLDLVAASGDSELESSDDLLELAGALAERDTARGLLACARALAAGRDEARIATDLVELLREQFLSTVAPEVLVTGASPVQQSGKRDPGDRSGQGTPGTGQLSPARCVRAMEVLGEASVAMRNAPDPRVTLEVAIVRLTHPEIDDSPGALLERLERLERAVRAQPGSAPTPLPEPAQPPSIGPRGGAPAESRAFEAVRGADHEARQSSSSLDDRQTGSPRSREDRASSAPEAGQEPTGSARRALGAFRGAPGASGSPPGPPPAGPSSPTTTAMSTGEPRELRRRAEEVATPGTKAVETESATSDPPSDSSEALPGHESGVATVPGGRSTPVPGVNARQSSPGFPSRDELVAAWGDHLLRGLRPKARALFQAGHILGIEGDTVLFGLPNEAHRLHAEPLCSEIAEVISGHFSERLRLRLVIDPGDTAGQDRGLAHDVAARAADEPGDRAPTVDEELSELDALRELEDRAGDDPLPVSGPSPGVSWAEDRLLQAFPGAEEV
jgi:DNA polymerase-3 subunit gamma/tau